MKSYGNILRELRQRAGYTIVDAARKLSQYGFEVTNTNISRWENGYNNPSLEQFLALCTLYGVDDMYAVFFDEDISGVGNHLNQEGFARLEAYHDLLTSSGWFGKDDRPLGSAMDAENSNDSTTYKMRMADGTPLEVEAQYWGRPPLWLESPDTGQRTRVGAGVDAADPHAPGHADLHRMTYADQHSGRRVPLYALGAEASTPFAAPTNNSALLDDTVPSHCDAAVEVEGSSMEPVIPAGSIVYVSTEDAVHNGDIGIVTLNGAPYIRQLRKTQDGAVWLVSANPAYKPLRVGEEDVLDVLAKVTEPVVGADTIAFREEDAVPITDSDPVQIKQRGRRKQRPEAVQQPTT